MGMILDGSGFVFRAYYALPELHDTQGRNTNAIFGFFRMLLKLLDYKPTYFTIARDSPVKTIRKEQFVSYKANRVQMPDEFKRQMGRIHELVEELRIPAVQVGGYEADDLIGILVKNSLEAVADIRIVSSDKDIKQLLQPWVSVYDPGKDLLSDVAYFEQEYGFSPEQLVDYLSLIGDSSDNVPGVPGIGPKTALELIKQYGSLEAIYAHLGEITPKIAEKLRAGEQSAQESKQLITLMHVPELADKTLVHFPREPDFEHMRRILVDQMHFHSLDALLSGLKKQRQAGEQLSLFG